MSNKIIFIFGKPGGSPGYLLARVAMLWQRKRKKILDPPDLTHTQFILMARRANRQDEATQGDIAVHNQFDRMRVSKVLRTLEARKILTRQEHHTIRGLKW